MLLFLLFPVSKITAPSLFSSVFSVHLSLCMLFLSFGNPYILWHSILICFSSYSDPPFSFGFASIVISLSISISSIIYFLLSITFQSFLSMYNESLSPLLASIISIYIGPVITFNLIFYSVFAGPALRFYGAAYLFMNGSSYCCYAATSSDV